MTNNEMLFEACKTGQLNEVERLLAPRKALIIKLKPLADVNSRDKDGATPLHWAANNGFKPVVECLLAHGADTEAKGTALGRTALHYAASKGQTAVIESLLAKGAAKEARDNNDETPLHGAASSGHEEVVKCLLANGADKEAKNKYGNTPYLYAKPQIKKLLENEEQRLSRLNSQLLESAKHGKIDLVKSSLIEGADKEARDRDGMTPMHLAAENGHLDIVQYLLASGADKNARGQGELTPLHSAAYLDHLAIVKCLLESGADIEAKHENHSTPLHQAAKHAGAGVVECLLAKGADKEARDIDRFTPLHWAALNGNLSVVQCLLASGANREAKDKDDLTPLHMASYKAHDAVVDYLLAKGANKEARTKNGLTYVGLHRGHYNQTRKTVQVFDARSEEEKQNERDGREGRDIPPVTNELYLLLVEANSWGRTHNWPHHDEYPQRQRVREIGELINNEYDFGGMQRVAYYIDAKNTDLTSHLSQFWHGVGSWMA
jgi:ankyrin repeat protein